jgi:succinate dehydrogenase/fumarate reductase flavoprotein subunit
MSNTADVIVIGSGAAGLATAVTAAHFGVKVIVLEKHHQIGGTSAWSGGWLWIPRNPLAQEAGINEGIDGPMAYLRSEIGNRVNDPRIPAFLEFGPKMVNFFREHAYVNWIDGNRIPDFHNSDGAREGGRSVSSAPFDGRRLGNWGVKLRAPLDVTTVWGMGIASGADMAQFFNSKRSIFAALHVVRRLGRHAVDLMRHGRGTQLVNGNALVAHLLNAALDLGVDIRLSSPVDHLVQNPEKTRITGVKVGSETFHAMTGVVLAAGGFPHDPKRHSEMFDHVQTGTKHNSAAPPENTGDGLNLAETVGAVVSDDLIEPGAWAPVSLVPQKSGVARFPHLIERAKPGFIAVTGQGRRFVNEANSYHDFMQALFKVASDNPFAWIICDRKAINRFGIGAVKPAPFPKGPHLASGYLKKGKTLVALADQIGVDPEAFVRTVTAFNQQAHQGQDPEFGRGSTPYNRIQGDPLHAPNPSLGALENAPFYAVKVVPGSLGTFAGIKTNEHAQVLNKEQNVINGLYAVGNDTASIMGGNYPSGGITLGPAMTFGYVAGLDIARKLGKIA